MRGTGRAVLACGAAGALLALSGCSAAQGEPIVDHGMYPEYGSMEELTDHADLVIVGTVNSSDVQVLDLLERSDSAGDPDLNPAADSDGQSLGGEFVMTVFHVVIEDVRAGDVDIGDTLEVAQLGGALQGQEYGEPGTDYLTVGDTFALFLASFDDAPAQPLNNTQAIYIDQATGFASLSSANSIAEEVEAELTGTRSAQPGIG